MKARIFLTGLALVALTSFASAQNPKGGRGNGNCNGTGKGVAFVDANNNGICDTYESRTANGTQRKGKGNCNGTGLGKGQGKGRNFVDANNNGVCDTYEARINK